MREVVNIVIGPPIPHPVGLPALEHWLLVRNGRVVDDTDHAVGVITAFELRML